MSETCKFCGKPGLNWDLNKDGDNALFTPSRREHVCKHKSPIRKSYFEMLEKQNEMEEYFKETIGPMHALTVAAYNHRER